MEETAAKNDQKRDGEMKFTNFSYKDDITFVQSRYSKDFFVFKHKFILRLLEFLFKFVFRGT